MNILNFLDKKYTNKFGIQIIETNFNYDETWQLQMPYLGVDFLKYLTGVFKSPIRSLLSVLITGEQIMTVLQFKNIYNLLVSSENSIYKTLEILNSFKIFHNDIKANNILFNSESNKMYLIDFDISKSINKSRDDFLHFTTTLDYEYIDFHLNFFAN
jgi:serine/threonine protein kinase